MVDVADGSRRNCACNTLVILENIQVCKIFPRDNRVPTEPDLWRATTCTILLHKKFVAGLKTDGSLSKILGRGYCIWKKTVKYRNK